MLLNLSVLVLAILFVIGIFGDRFLDVRQFRRLVNFLAATHWLVSVCLLVATVSSWVGFHRSPSTIQIVPPFLTFYVDGLSTLMLTLVGFVGWIVCRFAIRYLDGDHQQASFFRWAAIAITSVSLLAVSGNLMLFFIAWVTTSLSLHKLLLLYRNREEAHFAAWSKFTISRIGDGFLLMGLILVYRHFGTWQLDELFEQLKPLALNPASIDPSVHAMSWLFVLGAATKSAQFPFHAWLPETMETPTPVSALMHAGIVNAGGYLVIRLSPLISLTASSSNFLVVIGAVTAVLGGVVMLTVTSVKRSLAYSTIAQMGFMMLQCGLGAYSAAMLHIIAHSLYKAHAFLNSGNVIAESLGTKVITKRDTSVVQASPNKRVFALSVVAVIAFYLSTTYFLGIGPTVKPGGVVMSVVLLVSMCSLLWQANRSADIRLASHASAWAVALCSIYLISYMLIDAVIGNSIATADSFSATTITAIVLGLFAVLFFVDRYAPSWSSSALRSSFYIHASNGFYIEALMRRFARTLAS